MLVTLPIAIGIIIMSASSYQFTDKEKYIDRTAKALSSYRSGFYAEYVGIRALSLLIGTVCFVVPFISAIVYDNRVTNILGLVLAVMYATYVWTYFCSIVKYFSKKLP